MYSREKIFQVFGEITNSSQVIKPYVIILQPRRDLDELPAQNFETGPSLVSNVDVSGYSYEFAKIGGEMVDVARNYLFEVAIDSGAKYALSIGEDTVIPYDGFLKLHETAEKNPDAIVIGVYYMKNSSPMIHALTKDNQIIVPNVDPGQVIEACSCGLDCALIPIEILKKIKDDDPEIPFCCICSQPNMQFIGEDNFFIHRLHKLGFKILVNTDVQALHMDLVTGKYTAHPSVNLKNYDTNIPITIPFTSEDKEYIGKRWVDRLPNSNDRTLNGMDEPKRDLVVDFTQETEERVVKCLVANKTIQNYYEVSRLCERLDKLKPKTIVEIGVENGGSMAIWSEFATDDALYIGVDINIHVLKNKFQSRNQTIKFIIGDTLLDKTFNKLKDALEGREVDFLFIDGGHEYDMVKNDFQRFTPLVRKGGIIALHDVNGNLNMDGCEGVRLFWKELKETGIETEEFVNTGGKISYGIGVINVPE